jgi:acyl-CoA thioesterase-1
MTASPTRPLPVIAGVAYLLLAGHLSARAEAPNVAACLKYAAGMHLGAPLPHVRARLKKGKSITIVAFGSSSTEGFGTFDPAYPEVLKAELKRLRPSMHVTVINSGIVLDTIPGNVGRIGDVLHYHPDLVIWQLGTNDVLWRGIVPNAKALVRGGVRRIKKTGADVILMDLQYAPMVRSRPGTPAMEKLIASVAREEKVGLFSRFALMRRAIKGGVGGLVGFDSLHNSGAGYRCLGLALARLIDRESNTKPMKIKKK